MATHSALSLTTQYYQEIKMYRPGTLVITGWMVLFVCLTITLTVWGGPAAGRILAGEESCDKVLADLSSSEPVPSRCNNYHPLVSLRRADSLSHAASVDSLREAFSLYQEASTTWPEDRELKSQFSQLRSRLRFVDPLNKEIFFYYLDQSDHGYFYGNVRSSLVQLIREHQEAFLSSVAKSAKRNSKACGEQRWKEWHIADRLVQAFDVLLPFGEELPHWRFLRAESARRIIACGDPGEFLQSSVAQEAYDDYVETGHPNEAKKLLKYNPGFVR